MITSYYDVIENIIGKLLNTVFKVLTERERERERELKDMARESTMHFIAFIFSTLLEHSIKKRLSMDENKSSGIKLKTR